MQSVIKKHNVLGYNKHKNNDMEHNHNDSSALLEMNFNKISDSV